MNIIHIYDGHERVSREEGSVPNVVWNVAVESAKLGHQVTVLERKWSGVPKNEVIEGVNIRRLNLSTGPSKPWEQVPYKQLSSLHGGLRFVTDRVNFAIQALRYLRKEEFDIVHVHLPFAANVICTLSPGLREKMVYTAHIGELEKRVVDPAFSPDVYLSSRVSKTIVLNERTFDAFVSQGVDPAKLEIIPNGIETSRFETTSAEGDNSEILILFVGTITPRKGVVDLVQAMKHVNHRNDVKVLIVGRTDLDKSYVEEVKDVVSNSTGNIELTGFVSQERLENLYNSADIFVLPSYEEGSSIAVSEAIASGTPVIGSDIDGVSSRLEEHVHGIFFEPGNTDELSEHIQALTTNNTLRNNMKENMKELQTRYSWSAVTENIISTYGDNQ
ncbi:glycosyltransferase family 4 protein [Haloferax sp. YSMS24]|uniref:glycosyltransferase family 4 protein n=1 Tax=Haloferax sp. YSMS24 TaxID=3388425 RepID=UPI00398CB749